MRFLCIGDVIGRTGRNALKKFLPDVLKEYRPDFVILNGENAAGGFGLTKKVYEELLSLGVDVITSGNHIFDKKEVLQFIDKEEKLLRPANYPPGASGKGYGIYEESGEKVAVINLMGRALMGIPLDCPFRKFDEIYEKIKESVDYIVVDFHAEATSEKMAFGFYVDGRADIVFGTHSHVATADEMLLPKGTAYITDVGLTGAKYSVIGMKVEEPIQKFLTGMPAKYEVAKGKMIFQALFVEKTQQKTDIKRIKIEEE
ncbi:TIGR00282 family metallophosphoesterase [Persephonella atlantica]|uniref:TIGR00282 family metallophosphoesterase n=1 Tax=Persephonella atlantica TaxID=2699429 RepID=A0ABS1GJM2_9AQUI|nr:TIGR00282 family metallophosphoesterase [Persephonella atlantica]MBK3333134.1 TIGR00282 family metallophosphoesterase [Persephonella atlantica]